PRRNSTPALRLSGRLRLPPSRSAGREKGQTHPWNSHYDWYRKRGQVTWSSENTSIATVDNHGNVTAVSKGTVIIDAWYANYNYQSDNDCSCYGVLEDYGASTSILVQVPSRLVRFNSSCAPNGIGLLQTVNNGNIEDCLGHTVASGACEVYRNFTFQLADQNGTPLHVAYTITEAFSNMSRTTTNLPYPQGRTASVAVGGYGIDLQAAWYAYPNCLETNDNISYQQSFVVQVNGTNYPLSTLISISLGRFSGTYEVNDSITTP
ncbi:MAG TPA: Ig-like domain-containing protein, partial [Terriglobia bacterium]|nr:Ig-like domain-containing protein [Terriglobia bacterium]